MKKCLLSILFLLELGVLAQNIKPFKTYDSSSGGTYVNSEQYHEDLYIMLYQGFSAKPLARYTIIPSFFAESALSLEKKEDGYYLISNTLTESLWEAKNINNVKVITKSLKIDDKFSSSIIEIFSLITRVKETDAIGNDGADFIFETTDNNGNVLSIKTWSPQNSVMATAVLIGNQLFSLIDSKISVSEVENNISSFNQELRKQGY